MDEQKGTPSGLLVMGNVDHINRGIVVGVGEQVPEIRSGFTVWYSHGSGTEISGNGQSVKIIPADCIIAYEEDE